MTGFPRHELIGVDASSFYSSQEWSFLTQQVDIAFSAGHNRHSFVLPQRGGGRLPVIISSRTIRNSAGRFGIVTFTDLSEQVRAEQELRSANMELRKRQMEIEEDLRLAARVQRSLTPRSLTWKGMSVDSFYHPVHTIGGDFALVNSVNHEDLSLLVCDVSGHGIGSALVANRIYSEAAVHLRSGIPLVDMFSELNRFLIQEIDSSGMFVTAAAARIDAQQRTMFFAGAGHPPAMVARRGQSPILLESRSMILGALPEAVEITPQSSSSRMTASFCIPTELPKFSIPGEMLGIEGVQKSSAVPLSASRPNEAGHSRRWLRGVRTADRRRFMLVHVR
jgi:hypothetical protein